MKYLLLCAVVLLSLGISTVQAQAPGVPRGANLVQVAYTSEFNRIGSCESNGDLHAKNKGSSASGEFQFLNATWFHYGKELWGEAFYSKNIWSSDNRELAWYVYNKYGTHDWDASKTCWDI